MNATTETGKEVVNVVKDFGEMFSNAISVIADKLSIPVSHVYSVLVTQQFISGLSCIIIQLILIALCIFIFFKSNEKWSGEFDDIACPLVPIYISIGFIFTGVLIWFFVTFQTSMGQIFNPEYQAIQEIISFIKK